MRSNMAIDPWNKLRNREISFDIPRARFILNTISLMDSIRDGGTGGVQRLISGASGGAGVCWVKGGGESSPPPPPQVYHDARDIFRLVGKPLTVSAAQRG